MGAAVERVGVLRVGCAVLVRGLRGTDIAAYNGAVPPRCACVAPMRTHAYVAHRGGSVGGTGPVPTRAACHCSIPRVRVSAGLRGTVDAFDAARDSYHVRLSVKATSSSREAASASVTEQ